MYWGTEITFFDRDERSCINRKSDNHVKKTGSGDGFMVSSSRTSPPNFDWKIFRGVPALATAIPLQDSPPHENGVDYEQEDNNGDKYEQEENSSKE